MYKSLIFCLLLSFSLSARAQGLNDWLFSIEDEIKLGRQVAAEVEKDPKNKILDEKKYPQAYAHLRRVTNHILNSGQVKHKDQFVWQVKIIQNDSILNAFCAPGGFIYVYTGIIKFLDNEDQFAGVMAHEIAHADRRHATSNLVKAHGISLIMQLILGRNSQNQLAQIVNGLANLKFSRNHENEADEYSVIYLCNTNYRSDGAAGFFEKMLRSNKANQVPEFLSTHPNSANRVQNIKNAASQRKCKLNPAKDANYEAFKKSLPK
jgi:beta-barrel assembly-enhancing protease